MNSVVRKLLSELEEFGLSNDQGTEDQIQRMLNITRDTGEFLSVLVRATNAQQVLEIGTSNGYSTLWLADACSAIGGNVTTVELSEQKFKMAQQNFKRSDLSSFIKQILANAGDVLSELEDNAFDLIFLDSERTDYPAWWSDIKRVVRPGGLLVVDNAISHSDEIAPFISLVEEDSNFTTSIVPVGKGEYLATKSIEYFSTGSNSFGSYHGE